MEPWDRHPLPAAPRVSLELARNQQRIRKREVAQGEHERASREHRGAGGEHERAQREHGRATREHEGASREHLDETGLSGKAKRRGLNQHQITYCPQFGVYIYIYISLG